MKIRFWVLIELVAVVAVGLCFCRIYYLKRGDMIDGLGALFDLTIRSPLLGVAAAQALILVVERIAGRSPAVWGWGRCSWCVSGAYQMMKGLVVAAESEAEDWLAGDVDWLGFPPKVAFEAMDMQVFGDGAWALLAFVATAKLARLPQDPEPDIRERAGKAYAVLVIGAWLIKCAVDGLGLSHETYWRIHRA